MRTRTSPVLVADAGSSSLRLTVFGDGGHVLNEHHSESPPSKGAPQALRQLLKEGPPPAAAGHRIVHGGPELRSHTLLDDAVRARLTQVADLAPLHVPQALTVVDAARDLLPGSSPCRLFRHRLPLRPDRRGKGVRGTCRLAPHVRTAPLRLPRPLLRLGAGPDG
ncbi:hypothetical protein [Streptomyces sp. NPDC006415]|uniref:hypothetical protein n=1 Tax=Streptomyces sp. NPDC006415 TaxID=3155351 RepID=UPI0033A89324